MPTVGLVLIARDEAHVIGQAIQSGLNLGVSAVTVVLDDRTKDDTSPVAQALGADVVVRPFPGTIAAARNEANEIASEKTDYLLVLDPDDRYEGSLPTVLQADTYKVWIHDGGYRHQRVQLFRSGAGVRYEGVRHERAVVPDGATVSVAPSLIYVRVGGGYQDSLGQRAKFMAHVRDLVAWVKTHPDDTHATYVLAQSYRDAGEVELARQTYERRMLMEGGEEKYLAALEVAFLVEHDTSPGVEDVTGAYLRAHELSPLRAEPLFHLACYLREQNCLASAWHFARRASELKTPEDGTILDIEIYEWKAKAEVAIESWMLGDRATAMKLLFEIAHTAPEYKEWADEQLAIVSQQDPPERTLGTWDRSSALVKPTVEVE